MSKNLAAIALLLLAACAAPYHGTKMVKVVNYQRGDGMLVGNAGAIDPDDRLLCAEETPTGSHITKRLCRFEQESAALREESHEMLRRAMSSNSTRSATAADGSPGR
jgi:hypothetical protein